MEKAYNVKSKVVKGFATFAIITGMTVSTGLADNHSQAAENNQTQKASSKSAGEIVKIDDNMGRIDLNKNITYNVDENGIATLKDKNTNKTEQLPSTAKDKNGKNVNIVYFEEKGKLGMQVVPNQQDRKKKKGSVAKCVIGTAGGAVGGATAGGLTGAGVGTVTLPVVGTVSGGVVGTVGGGIGGASGGYVAGC
ncbi:hypothetical protein [Staphylococcus caprae]|uniref:hypothetical protein n=1 Tax=Staphylococcus caprae TaxID=29380 RepID=UPI003906074C